MQKENFVKCDWPTQIFRQKKCTTMMIFSENFLSVEIFLGCKWAFDITFSAQLTCLTFPEETHDFRQSVD